MPSSPDPSQHGQNLTPEQLVLRERKMKSLQASISDLQSQTEHLEAQIVEAKAQLKHDPSTTVKRHIRLLHDYNEIKDVGQGLMGLIAEARGMRQIEVQSEFGVGEKD